MYNQNIKLMTTETYNQEILALLEKLGYVGLPISTPVHGMERQVAR